MDDEELERKLALMGPAGPSSTRSRAGIGGDAEGTARWWARPRPIIRHTVRTESEDFAKKVGCASPEGALGGRPRRTATPTSRRSGRTTRRARSHAVVDAAVPDPAHRLPHAGSRLGDGGQGPHGRGPVLEQSLSRQRRAPLRMVLNFAHTTSSATRPQPAEVSNPQSVPASTRVGSPTTVATRSSLSATTSGCSTKLVNVSITPATSTWSSASR